MYLSKLYQSNDFSLLKEIVKENSFASLIIYKERIYSTKAMMQLKELEDDKFIIETHISKAYHLATTIADGDEVLCDFLGANAYISSSWYDHINVSTWNFEQVQIYGQVKIMSDKELYQHLESLTDQFESKQKCPMNFDRMDKEYIEQEMKGALGLQIIPTEINIKQKLSQNRDETNFQRIIDNLNASNVTSDKILAQKMEALRKSRDEIK